MDYHQLSTEDLEELLRKDFEADCLLDENALLSACTVLAARSVPDANEAEAAWARFVAHYMPHKKPGVPAT